MLEHVNVDEISASERKESSKFLCDRDELRRDFSDKLEYRRYCIERSESLCMYLTD